MISKYLNLPTTTLNLHTAAYRALRQDLLINPSHLPLIHLATSTLQAEDAILRKAESDTFIFCLQAVWLKPLQTHSNV